MYIPLTQAHAITPLLIKLAIFAKLVFVTNTCTKADGLQSIMTCLGLSRI